MTDLKAYALLILENHAAFFQLKREVWLPEPIGKEVWHPLREEGDLAEIFDRLCDRVNDDGRLEHCEFLILHQGGFGEKLAKILSLLGCRRWWSADLESFAPREATAAPERWFAENFLPKTLAALRRFREEGLFCAVLDLEFDDPRFVFERRFPNGSGEAAEPRRLMEGRLDKLREAELLGEMAYLVFQSDLAQCREQGIVFEKPAGAPNFPESLSFVEATSTAAANSRAAEALLGDLWRQGALFDGSAPLRATLRNQAGQERRVEFAIPAAKLAACLRRRVEETADLLHQAMRAALEGWAPHRVHALISGDPRLCGAVAEIFWRDEEALAAARRRLDRAEAASVAAQAQGRRTLEIAQLLTSQMMAAAQAERDPGWKGWARRLAAFPSAEASLFSWAQSSLAAAFDGAPPVVLGHPVFSNAEEIAEVWRASHPSEAPEPSSFAALLRRARDASVEAGARVSEAFGGSR